MMNSPQDLERFKQDAIEIKRKQVEEAKEAQESALTVREEARKNLRRLARLKKDAGAKLKKMSVDERIQFLSGVVGYDPNKDYTIEELAHLAEQALAYNRAQGIKANHGLGDEGESEYWHEEDTMGKFIRDKMRNMGQGSKQKWWVAL